MNNLILKVLFLGFVSLLPSICLAANDCNAVISKASQIKKETSWILKFKVTTTCQSSTGRFTYTYIDDKDKLVERQSPSWAAADGKHFTLEDEIGELGGLQSLTVIGSSIESTKVPWIFIAKNHQLNIQLSRPYCYDRYLPKILLPLYRLGHMRDSRWAKLRITIINSGNIPQSFISSRR